MGFWNAMKSLGDRVAKQALVSESFERGKQGKPPLGGFSDTPVGQEAKRIADEAYELGQKSVLVKIGNKIAGE